MKIYFVLMLLAYAFFFFQKIETFSVAEEEARKNTLNKIEDPSIETILREFIPYTEIPVKKEKGITPRQIFILKSIVKFFKTGHTDWKMYQKLLLNVGNINSNLAHFQSYQQFLKMGKGINYAKVKSFL